MYFTHINFIASSSNNQSVDQSAQQILQNGVQNGQFALGLDPPIKLEPGDTTFNFPFTAYHRPWTQVCFLCMEGLIIMSII